jgi:hypothetical protein
VPGSPREQADAVDTPPVVEFAPPHQVEREQLPPIEVFLDDEASPGYDESRELPPVEHFVDPLPEVASFAPDTDGALIEESGATVEFASPADAGRSATETGWGVEDWQQYDWRSAATLREGAESQASNEWATTDWEVGRPAAATDRKPSAAQALANALDQIAQQIREGDLTVPSPAGALTDPGAIAATLAALLGVRR